MFGIGLTEFILLLVLTLLIFGPEKIPTVAKTMAKIYRELRTTSAEFTDIIKGEMDDIPRSLNDLTHNLDSKSSTLGFDTSKKTPPPPPPAAAATEPDWSQTIETTINTADASAQGKHTSD